jgi:hypothetical protein
LEKINYVGYVAESFFRNQDTVVYTSTNAYDNTGNTYQKLSCSINKGQGFKHLNILTDNNKIKDVIYKNNIIYTVGEKGFFGLASEDFSSFKQIKTNTIQELISVDVVNEKDWFLGGGFNNYEYDLESGIILGTNDGGNLWYSSSFPEQIRKIKMYDSKIGYAIPLNRIYKTTNGGIINVLEDNDNLTKYPYPNPTSDVLHTHNEEEKSIFNLKGNYCGKAMLNVLMSVRGVKAFICLKQKEKHING